MLQWATLYFSLCNFYSPLQAIPSRSGGRRKRFPALPRDFRFAIVGGSLILLTIGAGLTGGCLGRPLGRLIDVDIILRLPVPFGLPLGFTHKANF